MKEDKKIKVGFDISQVAHGGGVASYTQNLAENLNQSKDLEMVFFYSSLRKPYKGRLHNVKKFKLPPTLFEMLFNKWRNVPIEKFIGPVDIFHSSDWIQPPTKAKNVTTYHDVIPLKYPEWSEKKIIEVHKRRLKIVEKEIDRVIAVSESTKKDLIEISNIPEEKIVVIYEGVDGRFKPQSEVVKLNFRKKYNLPEKFVLAISGRGERRNLKRVKEASKKYNLVITGETIIPYLDDSEMPILYSCAQALVYPSLYEGFGLPILEAMSCGIPVVTSNVSSMPEIGGEAALYVDPLSVTDIQKKLDQVTKDQGLREGLIKKGLLRVKKFTWQKAADQTAQIYKELVNS